jgi:hypothetical protein
MAQHIDGLVVIKPRYAVGTAAVQAGMGAEQPERHPAFVDVRGSGGLKPADIMAPEGKTAQRQ